MYQATTERNLEVNSLLSALNACSVGGVITWEELDQALGREVRPSNRDLLHRALAKLSDDSGIIFESVKGVDYKRLSPNSAHLLGHRARSRTRRVAKLATKRIINATTRGNLSQEANLKANAELSVLGLINHLAKDKFVDKQAETSDRPKNMATLGKEFLQHIGVKL